MKIVHVTTLAIAGLLAAACGSSGSSDVDGGGGQVDAGADAGGCPVTPPGDPATVELRGACPLSEAYGSFQVYENGQYSAIAGSLSDGVVPQTILEEIAAEGDCKLLRRPNPFCNPPCETGETCRQDGVCVPFPLQQDIGAVTIQGLAECFELTARQPGNSYYETDVPHPAFAPGALVRMTTGAGAFGPLELHGVGVTPLVVETTELTVARGTALSLAWGAPQEGARSRVRFHLNIDQHGTSPVTIFCDFPDTGSATVPAAMVDAMFDAGVSGFPNSKMVRRTVDSQAAGEGCAELIVASDRTISITVQN
jgi:hypothetical protein